MPMGIKGYQANLLKSRARGAKWTWDLDQRWRAKKIPVRGHLLFLCKGMESIWEAPLSRRAWKSLWSSTPKLPFQHYIAIFCTQWLRILAGIWKANRFGGIGQLHSKTQLKSATFEFIPPLSLDLALKMVGHTPSWQAATQMGNEGLHNERAKLPPKIPSYLTANSPKTQHKL